MAGRGERRQMQPNSETERRQRPPRGAHRLGHVGTGRPRPGRGARACTGAAVTSPEALAREVRLLAAAERLHARLAALPRPFAMVDVCGADALELADRFLPETPTCSRRGVPRARRFYLAPGTGDEKFCGVATVRTTAAIAACGIDWSHDADGTDGPLCVEAAELRRRVAKLNAAALVKRHAAAAFGTWLATGADPHLPPTIARKVRELLAPRTSARARGARARSSSARCSANRGSIAGYYSPGIIGRADRRAGSTGCRPPRPARRRTAPRG